MMRFRFVKWGGIFLAVLASVTMFIGITFGDADPEKIRDIKKLLAVSGIQEQLSYMKEGVLNSYSRMIAVNYPKIPDAFWKEFNQLVGDKEMNALVDVVVPVYDKHMSHEVIQKLIKMFETPFWKEWREKMPAISREAGVAGQQWTMELTQSEDFAKKLDALVKKYELEKLNAGQRDAPKTK